MNAIDVRYEELNYEELGFLPSEELIDLLISKDHQVKALIDFIKEEKELNHV